MRLREVEAFERTHGYKPTALRVAIDAIGIFVHQDNPVKGLNFLQLDAIFSATLRCGAEDFVSTWVQLGINAEWAKRNFQLFGRNSVSGTYGYYSGVGYRVAGVRLLPIAKRGNEFVYPSRENILTGDYPLSRYLYVYVNKHPNKPLSPIEAEFIKFIYSAQGQALVEKDGYVSITRDFAQAELAKVGL